jgi:chromosome segregation ATPase
MAQPHHKERDMAQKSLLQMLEDLASKVRSLELERRQAAAKMQALEREKNEAAAKTGALERDVGEMAALITQAAGKVEEILKFGADVEVSQPQTVTVPKESTSRERLGEFSTDLQNQPKQIFPQAFITD